METHRASSEPLQDKARQARPTDLQLFPPSLSAAFGQTGASCPCRLQNPLSCSRAVCAVLSPGHGGGSDALLSPLWRVNRNLPSLYHGAPPGTTVCAFPAAVLGAEVSASARVGHSSPAPAWTPRRRPDTRVGRARWTRGTWENPAQTVARTLATSRAHHLPEPLRAHNHVCPAWGRAELLVGRNPPSAPGSSCHLVPLASWVDKAGCWAHRHSAGNVSLSRGC